MSLKSQKELLSLSENGLSFTDSVLNELHEIESGSQLSLVTQEQ